MGPKIVLSCFTLMVLCYAATADDDTVDLLDVLLKRMMPSCKISMNCPSKTDICHEHSCRRNVPCNKDNDCFFWGAADVANGAPHPKCYRKKGESNLPAGYGVCMLSERVENDPNLLRMKGDDVDSLDVHPIDIHNMH